MPDHPSKPSLLTRRALVASAPALLAAIPHPAAAQPRLVQGPAIPCLAGREDIVGLALTGTGTPAGTVVVFGQAFRQGDLPQGSGIGARASSGQRLPSQLDVTTRHADGSVRFAIISLATPALRAGERLGVVLSRLPQGDAPMLDVVAAAQGRSAVVEILPHGAGTPWRVDLLLRLQDAALQRIRPALWQQGPLAVQARTQIAVPRERVGGVTSARLVADLSLRADGALMCNAWLRNDGAMQAGGGRAHYAMRILLDGRIALETPTLAQFQYTSFGRSVGSARGSPAPRPARVHHDMTYLTEAGAIARYDLSVGVDTARLEEFGRLLASPTWHQPFDARGLATQMGAGGNRGDLGPTTLWQAAWIISGDRRAEAVSLGQAEASGSVPWHFWDGGNGTWLNTDHYPRLWTDARGGTGVPGHAQSGGLTQQVDRATGWELSSAHQPDLSFVPYLLTGERWILDNLNAQAAWSVMGRWPNPRQDGEGILVGTGEVRAAAWSIRQVENAAWINPDGSAEKAYFDRIAQNNWNHILAKIPEWTAMQGEAHGWIPGHYGVPGAMPPWQQEFFVSTAASAARRGRTGARATLAWMANFIVGRFHAEAFGFSPFDGIAYNLAVMDPSGRRVFRTWSEITQATRERGMSNNNTFRGSPQGYYGQLGLQSLAAMVDLFADEPARRAYEWLRDAAPPFTRPADLASSPNLAIVPRDMPRVPGRVPRCVAA